jgi:hypothetical protein
MTNNPYKIRELEKLGVNIHSRHSVIIDAGVDNAFYLETKAKRQGHMLNTPSPQLENPFSNQLIQVCFFVFLIKFN